MFSPFFTSLLHSRLSGCHATLLPPFGGALRDIPKEGYEGDYFFTGCRVKFCSLKLMRCFCDWCIPIIVHETEFLKSEDEKQTGMLVVSLWGVNFGFWSRLGFSGHSTNVLSRQETPNYAKRNSSQIFFLSCFVFVFVFKQSLLGIKICLIHGQIGLL